MAGWHGVRPSIYLLGSEDVPTLTEAQRCALAWGRLLIDHACYLSGVEQDTAELSDATQRKAPIVPSWPMRRR